MKILFVYDAVSYIGGGSQQACLSWMKNLEKRGATVKIVFNNNQPVIKTLGLREKLILAAKAISINYFFPQMTVSPLLLSGLKKNIIAFNPDIIHFHEPSLLAYQLMRFANKKKFLTFTSFHTRTDRIIINQFPLSLVVKEKGLVNKLVQRMQNYLLKKSDYITAPTKITRDYLIRKTRKTVFMLPYPIDSRFFRKVRSDDFRGVHKLVTVSRLSGEKNLVTLIKAMKHLKDRDCSLTIYGEGADKKFLRKTIKKLGLDGKVVLAGWIKNNDLPQVLDKYDLYLLASKSESFGFTYIEALAKHIPCLVADFSVSREVIPADMAVFMKTLSPAAWAKKIKSFQDNPETYIKMKKAIESRYSLIKQYNESNSTRNLIRIYNSALKRLPVTTKS